MRLWKKFTLTGGMIWGLKSIMIGFGGYAAIKAFPILKFFSGLDILSFWVGIWGISLVSVCSMLFLRELHLMRIKNGH